MKTVDIKGISKHPEYWRWNNIRNRCLYPSHNDYPSYGGRGITICPEWEQSSACFITWIINQPNYSREMTVERNDVNGPYSPENCKLIPNEEQALNKTTNIHVYINDEKLSIAKALVVLNRTITVTSVYKRLRKGWTMLQALLRPERCHLILLDSVKGSIRDRRNYWRDDPSLKNYKKRLSS